MSGLEILGSAIFTLAMVMLIVGPFIAVKKFRVMRQVVGLLGVLFLLFGLFTWFILRPWDLDNTTPDFWNAIPLAIGVLYLLMANWGSSHPGPRQDRIEEPLEIANNYEKVPHFVSCVCPACEAVVEISDRENAGQIIECPACHQKVVMDRR